MIWGPTLAWYLFLAGLAAGAYATSAIANIKHPQSTKKLQIIGRLIAPIAVIVGLLLLVVDARAGFHNPLRFFNLFTNWGSVMTWGTAILTVFTIFAVISAVIVLAKKTVPKGLDYVGIFLSLCTAVYTGVLIGVVQTYPLWNNAVLPVLFVVSGFSAGLAATLLFSEFFARKETEKLEGFKKYHFTLPILEILLLAALLYITAHRGTNSGDYVSALLSGNLAVAFWVGLIVVGLLLPILLEIIRLIISNNNQSASASGGVLVMETISSAGTLVGGFLLRYLILMAAVPLVFLN